MKSKLTLLIAIFQLLTQVAFCQSIGEKDQLAKNQALRAIELFRQGKYREVWPLLELTPNPSGRSYFIRDIGISGVPVEPIVKQLAREPNVAIKRALILCLGGFDKKRIVPRERKIIVDLLLKTYRVDPDPGVHSAIDWLFRYGKRGLASRALNWDQSASLSRIDSIFAGKSPENRNWLVTKHGQTLSILKGPVEFIMGTPTDEPGREKGDVEAIHKERIPRSFAIATKEITVGQFQQFLDANPEIKLIAQNAGRKNPGRNGAIMKQRITNDNSPQILMTWFEAAQYCNWLSAQEGIPKEEWCYPTLQEIKEGMVLPKLYLHRKGYRLPTEAEWQFACRAGTTSSRYFGFSEELLPQYAWYTGDTFNEHPWPVGELKPNDFGLFDMYGNVWEWGENLVKQYKSGSVDSLWIDQEDEPSIVSKDYKRPRLGASYTYPADYLRSGYRNDGYIPDERRDSVGFRIAKTIDNF